MSYHAGYCPISQGISNLANGTHTCTYDSDCEMDSKCCFIYESSKLKYSCVKIASEPGMCLTVV